jgi:hypothetical protein
MQEAAQDRTQQHISGPGVADEDDSKQRDQRHRRDVVEPVEHAFPLTNVLQVNDAMWKSAGARAVARWPIGAMPTGVITPAAPSRT